MKRLLFLLTTILVLVSFSLNEQYHKELSKLGAKVWVYVTDSDGNLVKCEPMESITLPNPPEIPSIPDALIGNSDAEKQFLIQALKDHRVYINEIRAKVKKDFETYQRRCLKTL